MLRRTTDRALRWAAVLAWAAVIFGMSSLPGSSVPGDFSVPAHFTEYAILGALLCFALLPGRPARTAFVAAVLLASLYGASDEWHQSFVPMRTPDVADWILDTLGALAGAALIAALASRRRSRPPSEDRRRVA